MPDIDKRVLIAAPIIALIVFALGFGLGALITGGSANAQATGSEGSSAAGAESQSGVSVGGTSVEGEPSDTTLLVGDAAAVIVPPKTGAADIPEYGSSSDRDDLINGLVEAGVSGGSRAVILASADRVCYNLERLEAQERSPAFAVRVVWNESLAELDKEDLAVFSAVFSATPFFLCPNSLDYSREVAYWLGY